MDASNYLYISALLFTIGAVGVVGLAIIVTIYRSRRSASVDDASLLKR